MYTAIASAIALGAIFGTTLLARGEPLATRVQSRRTAPRHGGQGHREELWGSAVTMRRAARHCTPHTRQKKTPRLKVPAVEVPGGALKARIPRRGAQRSLVLLRSMGDALGFIEASVVERFQAPITHPSRAPGQRPGLGQTGSRPTGRLSSPSVAPPAPAFVETRAPCGRLQATARPTPQTPRNDDT